MNVSINPTYLCNLRCDFCYLTTEQLSDPRRMDLTLLDQRLSELDFIEHVDLYGGEISALPVDYQHELLAVIRKHYDGTVNINTNLIKVSPLLFEPNVTTSVSFDGPARDRWETTLCNIATLPIDVAVLILCSPKVIEWGVQNMLDICNGFRNIISVEIKPYSSNQSNALAVDYEDFESYVMEWLDRPRTFDFNFQNRDRIENTLIGGYSAWSDDHIYVTPSGKFAVLEFDLNDNEFFLELDDLNAYKEWTLTEKKRVAGSYCGECKYLGRCLTEHYRYVGDVVHSCNGFHNLLQWYDDKFIDDTYEPEL